MCSDVLRWCVESWLFIRPWREDLCKTCDERKAHFLGFLCKNFEHKLRFPSLHAVPYGVTFKKFRQASVSFFFFFFLITVPSGFSLRNPLLFLQGCFHPAPTLPDKRLNDNLTKGEVYALLIAAFLGKGIGLKNIRWSRSGKSCLDE